MTEKSRKSLKERALDADVRSSRWLADGNAASEAGNKELAEKCWAKSQYWLDRYTLLTGGGDKPPPRY